MHTGSGGSRSLIRQTIVREGVHIAAFRFTFRFLLRPLTRMPVVGGWIEQQIERILAEGEAAAQASADAALQPLVDAIQAFRVWIDLVPNATVGALHETAGAIWRVRYQALPAFFREAWDFTARVQQAAADLAYGLHGQALEYATQVGRDANAFTARVQVAAYNLAYALHGQAIDYATSLHQQETQFTLQVRQDLINYVGKTADVLHGEIVSDTQAAERYAQDLNERLLAYIDAGLSREEAFIRASIDTEARARVRGVSDAQIYAYKLSTAIYSLPCIQQCATLGKLGGELGGLDLVAIILQIVRASTNPPRGAPALLDEFLPHAEGLLGEVRKLIQAA